MASATSSIQFRRGTTSGNAAQLSETFNAITDLIDASGMVRLSNTEFAGQSGVFTSDEPEAGQTKVTQANANGFITHGTNAWKHPTRELYLAVDYIDSGYTTVYRTITPRFRVGTSLLDGTFSGDSISVAPMDNFLNGGHPIAVQSLLNSYIPCYAHCDADSFWIGSDAQIITSMSTANVTYACRLPTNSSPIAFGVFYSGANMAIFSAQQALLVYLSFVGPSGNFPGGAWGANVNGQTKRQTIRTWTSIDGTGFTYEKDCPLCTFIDSKAMSDTSGVRLTRAQMYFDGVVSLFGFGWINGAATTDSALINADLLGTGSRTFRVMKTFGSGVPDYYGSEPINTAVLVLPWDV